MSGRAASHPAACVLSNRLSTATARPWVECARSDSLFSRIRVNNWTSINGVTTLVPSIFPSSSVPSPGVPTRLSVPLRLSENVRFKLPLVVVVVVVEYGDPACVCGPWNAPRTVSLASPPSSRYRSHAEYSEIISCAIVATRDMDTLSPAKKPMISCGFLESMDEFDAWRDDRRGALLCASLGTLEDDFGRTRSLVGACRTSVR